MIGHWHIRVVLKYACSHSSNSHSHFLDILQAWKLIFLPNGIRVLYVSLCQSLFSSLAGYSNSGHNRIQTKSMAAHWTVVGVFSKTRQSTRRFLKKCMKYQVRSRIMIRPRRACTKCLDVLATKSYKGQVLRRNTYEQHSGYRKS